MTARKKSIALTLRVDRPTGQGKPESSASGGEGLHLVWIWPAGRPKHTHWELLRGTAVLVDGLSWPEIRPVVLGSMTAAAWLNERTATR